VIRHLILAFNIWTVKLWRSLVKAGEASSRSRARGCGSHTVGCVPDPASLDPIAEAHRQWSARWPEHADHMAAVTSVMRVQQLLLSRVEDVLKPYGLTFALYEALRLLAFSRAGSLPMGKMGARLMVHPAAVTNAIGKLEQRQLVRRSMSPEDRRVVLAAITPAGRALADEATDALNQADFGLLGLTPAQAAELTRALRDIRDLAGDLHAGGKSLGPAPPQAGGRGQRRVRSRLMTSRWIWLAPSKIRITSASRMHRSAKKSWCTRHRRTPGPRRRSPPSRCPSRPASRPAPARNSRSASRSQAACRHVAGRTPRRRPYRRAVTPALVLDDGLQELALCRIPHGHIQGPLGDAGRHRRDAEATRARPARSAVPAPSPRAGARPGPAHRRTPSSRSPSSSGHLVLGHVRGQAGASAGTRS
jgi:DNA-binding MarR family transcriptional regulator